MPVRRRVPKPKFGGVRTGGRSARVVDQVLLTTLELLGEVGYGALRIDDVASRSGVNKTTIYRRWPTKSQLVVAAAQRHHVYAPSPDTGDLVRDLTDMFVEQMSHVDVRLMRGLMRMTLVDQPDPELQVIKEQTREAVLAMRLPRFTAAVKRGELPKKTDIVMLLSLISTTIYSRLLIHQEKPTPELVSDIVTMMVEGARVKWARAASPKRR